MLIGRRDRVDHRTFVMYRHRQTSGVKAVFEESQEKMVIIDELWFFWLFRVDRLTESDDGSVSVNREARNKEWKRKETPSFWMNDINLVIPSIKIRYSSARKPPSTLVL